MSKSALPILLATLTGILMVLSGLPALDTGSSPGDGAGDATRDAMEGSDILSRPVDEGAETFTIPDDDPGTRGNEAVTFTEVSDTVGLGGLTANYNYLAWADYNNDGYLDIIANGRKVMRNNGPPGWNFTDMSSASGLPQSGVSSGTWGDYDNDGYLDVYQSRGLHAGNHLMHNDGDGTFTEVTSSAGGVTTTHPTTGASWADYDRDGNLDLFITNGEWWPQGENYRHYPNYLWNNDGDGTFTNTTSSAGIPTAQSQEYSRGSNWGDFDNDGWPDLYVSNYRLIRNYLYVNDRDGTFTEVAQDLDAAGVYDPATTYDQTAGETYGQYWWGPTWGHTIGSAWGDYDNDGFLDMWTSNLVHKYVGPTSWPTMPYDIRGYVCDDSHLYHNPGPGPWNFSDARPGSGIAYKPIGGGGTFQGDELFDGVAWGDYDNDGDLDLWIPQVYDLDYAYSFLYRNNGDGTFTDMADTLGLRVYNTYSGCWGDYDDDGDLDLIASGKQPFVAEGQGTYKLKLWRNSGNANHWLHVSLNGTVSNSHGIGAQVRIKTADGLQMREVEGGMGAHGHQNSIPVEFGLGAQTVVDELEVRWPSGIVQYVKNPAADQMHNLTEPSDGPTVDTITASPLTVNEDEWVTFGGSATMGDYNIKKYLWDFDGDGTYDFTHGSSTVASASFPKAGTYYARLTVLDNRNVVGFSDTVAVEVLNVAPDARLQPDLTADEDQLLWLFGNNSFDTPSDRLNLTYEWDFGDGTGMEESPTPVVNHTYTEEGFYTIGLKVYDDDGVNDTTVVNVTVKNVLPWVEFTSAPEMAREDESVTFDADGFDTPSDIPYLQFQWNYGDGKNDGSWSSDAGRQHTYTGSGIFTLTLSVKDDDDTAYFKFNITVVNVGPEITGIEDREGVEDSLIFFTASADDTSSDKGGLTYMWDFGDGNSTDWAVAPSSQHTYERAGGYEAWFLVRDDDLNVTAGLANVTIANVPPELDALDDQEVMEDEVLYIELDGFDTPSDRPTLEFRVDFGDGTATGWTGGVEFNHSYGASGEYRVRAYVRDDDLNMTSVEALVTVYNLVPEADFDYDEASVDEDSAIVFTASDTTDSPSDVPGLEYFWDFGDGDTGEGLRVKHVFRTSGRYSVELTVTDGDGDDDSEKATVNVRNVAPVAAAGVDEDTGGTTDAFTFSAAGTYDTPTDLANLSYEWSFGDKEKDDGADVVHFFGKGGVYKVRLTVTDGDGARSEATVTVFVTGDEHTVTLGPFKDDEGEPLEGASVTLFGSDGVALVQGDTDEGGIVTLVIQGDPPDGAFDVLVQRDGYDDEEFTVTLSGSDDDVDVDYGDLGGAPALDKASAGGGEEEDLTLLMVIGVLVVVVAMIMVMMVVLKGGKAPVPGKDAGEAAVAPDGEAGEEAAGAAAGEEGPALPPAGGGASPGEAVLPSGEETLALPPGPAGDGAATTPEGARPTMEPPATDGSQVPPPSPAPSPDQAPTPAPAVTQSSAPTPSPAPEPSPAPGPSPAGGDAPQEGPGPQTTPESGANSDMGPGTEASTSEAATAEEDDIFSV